jgi:hypothetical protein
MYRVQRYDGAVAHWRIDHPDRLILDSEVRTLEVSLISGRLNVVGTDGPARVEVATIGRKPLLVAHDGGRLMVRHEEPRRWPGVFWWLFRQAGRYRTDVSVAVPRDTDASLRVVSGSLVVSALTGAVDADATSGRITMLGLSGRSTAKAISGSIEALGISGDLNLETVSGEITLGDASARRLRARAVSGAITCDLDNRSGSEIRLETTSGEITVRVREDSDLDVSLHAMSGRLTSTFAELPTTGGHGANRTVTGRLGAGTGRLVASAISGNISLLRRAVEPDERSERGSR